MADDTTKIGSAAKFAQISPADLTDDC